MRHDRQAVASALGVVVGLSVAGASTLHSPLGALLTGFGVGLFFASAGVFLWFMMVVR